jgi:hypothetical protein
MGFWLGKKCRAKDSLTSATGVEDCESCGEKSRLRTMEAPILWRKRLLTRSHKEKQ